MPEELRLGLSNAVHDEVLVHCIAKAAEEVDRRDRLAVALLEYYSTNADREDDAVVVRPWSWSKELYAHVAAAGLHGQAIAVQQATANQSDGKRRTTTSGPCPCNTSPPNSAAETRSP